MIGFDYTERIDPAALKAAGCSVVFRYLSQPGWPKNLTKPEADELLAGGIAIVLNYETTADFMLGGYSAGVSCARSARAQATALGSPPDRRIYYSADFDATAAQIPAILDFDRGAASVDGAPEVGGYGGLRVALAEDAAGFRTWQTVAWSGGQWDMRSLARQTGEQRTIGGVVVDVNQIIDLAALGAWGGPTTGGSDVNLTDTVTVSAGFAARYGATAADGFTAGAAIPVGVLLEGAAIRAANNEHLLQQIAAKVGAPTDVAALAAQLGPLLHPTTDVEALATALENHNIVQDAKSFADELVQHVKVVSQ